MSSRFSNNSEAFALELIENLEEMFLGTGIRSESMDVVAWAAPLCR